MTWHKRFPVQLLKKSNEQDILFCPKRSTGDIYAGKSVDAHPDSTGLCRIISGLLDCFRAGRVRRMGCGEDGLESRLLLWSPGVEERRGERQTSRKKAITICTATMLPPAGQHSKDKICYQSRIFFNFTS